MKIKTKFVETQLRRYNSLKMLGLTTLSEKKKKKETNPKRKGIKEKKSMLIIYWLRLMDDSSVINRLISFKYLQSIMKQPTFKKAELELIKNDMFEKKSITCYGQFRLISLIMSSS
jgi:hypothetical protein